MDINYIDRDHYHVIVERYEKFRENMVEPNKEVVRVFDPLSKKQLEELQLIREVTGTLQQKLNDDLKKASAQAAADAAAQKEAKETPEPKPAE